MFLMKAEAPGGRLKTMKNQNLLLMLAALSGFGGCASFNSGDLQVERGAARWMTVSNGYGWPRDVLHDRCVRNTQPRRWP